MERSQIECQQQQAKVNDEHQRLVRNVITVMAPSTDSAIMNGISDDYKRKIGNFYVLPLELDKFGYIYCNQTCLPFFNILHAEWLNFWKWGKNCSQSFSIVEYHHFFVKSMMEIAYCWMILFNIDHIDRYIYIWIYFNFISWSCWSCWSCISCAGDKNLIKSK